MGNSKTKKIAVVGSGSWATAIVKILLNNVNAISWFTRKQEDIDYIFKYKHNPRYLSSVEFDTEKINLSSDIKKTIHENDIIILAIPSAFCHATLKQLSKDDFNNKIIFSAIKGIIP